MFFRALYREYGVLYWPCREESAGCEVFLYMGKTCMCSPIHSLLIPYSLPYIELNCYSTFPSSFILVFTSTILDSILLPSSPPSLPHAFFFVAGYWLFFSPSPWLLDLHADCHRCFRSRWIWKELMRQNWWPRKALSRCCCYPSSLCGTWAEEAAESRGGLC